MRRSERDRDWYVSQRHNLCASASTNLRHAANVQRSAVGRHQDDRMCRIYHARIPCFLSGVECDNL